MSSIVEFKHWYVYRHDHHRGPYSLSELQASFHRGVLSENSILWMEGSPDWRILKEWDDFIKIIPPSLPLDEKNSPGAAGTLLSEYDPHPPNSNPTQPLERKRWSNKIYLLGFFFIIALTLYLNEYFSTKIPLEGLHPKQAAKLTKILNRGGKLRFELGMKEDGSGIYLSSNLREKSLILLRLRSKETSIDLKTIGIFDKDPILLKDFEFIKGKTFKEGKYKYRIEILEIPSLIKRLKSFFIGGEIPLHKKRVSGFFLAFKQTEQEYLLFKKKKKRRDFYHLFLEKYQTLSSLLGKIRDFYLRDLKSSEKGSDMKVFEQAYRTEIAPLLQALFYQDRELSKTTQSQDRHHLQKSMKSLENIRTFVMLRLEETQKNAHLTKIKKKYLEDIFSERMKILSFTLQKSIHLYRKEMRLLQ